MGDDVGREDGLAWAAGYVALLAVIVAYSWVSYSNGQQSGFLLFAQPWVPSIVAFLCGASVCFFIPSLPKLSGATIGMCILAYVIALTSLSSQESSVYHLSVYGMQNITVQVVIKVMTPTIAPLSLYVIYIILPSLTGCWLMYRFSPEAQDTLGM